MAEVRRLVVDVLKPHEPGIVGLTSGIAGLEGVEGVNSSLIEVDEDVKNVKITVEGSFETGDVRQLLEDKGASVHSIDEVAAGDTLVEKVSTPQD